MDFFNLINAGDKAIIRLLHTGVKTIENVNVHTIMVDNKRKTIRCCGNNCPLCQANQQAYNRAYIRLFDYSDNKEKIWIRTDTILKQFNDIQQAWGDLSNCVMQITRVTQEFPKYDIQLLNPVNFPMPSLNKDEKCAYRFYLTRSVDEITQFMRTGNMPLHQKPQNQNSNQYNIQATYMPKDQYFGNHNVAAPNNQNQYQPFQPSQYQQSQPMPQTINENINNNTTSTYTNQYQNYPNITAYSGQSDVYNKQNTKNVYNSEQMPQMPQQNIDDIPDPFSTFIPRKI